MGAAGRRGAAPGFICAPLGTIFSAFVGSPGAWIGFSDKIWLPRSRFQTKVAEFEVEFEFELPGLRLSLGSRD